MESQVDAAVLPVGESGENQGWLQPIGANWSLLHGLHANLLCFLFPSHISIPNKLPFLLVCQLSFVTPGIIQHPCPLAHSMRFPRWANRLCVRVRERAKRYPLSMTHKGCFSAGRGGDLNKCLHVRVWACLHMKCLFVFAGVSSAREFTNEVSMCSIYCVCPRWQWN